MRDSTVVLVGFLILAGTAVACFGIIGYAMYLDSLPRC